MSPIPSSFDETAAAGPASPARVKRSRQPTETGGEDGGPTVPAPLFEFETTPDLGGSDPFADASDKTKPAKVKKAAKRTADKKAKKAAKKAADKKAKPKRSEKSEANPSGEQKATAKSVASAKPSKKSSKSKRMTKAQREEIEQDKLRFELEQMQQQADGADTDAASSPASWPDALNSGLFELKKIGEPFIDPPRLAHGLERVLFNRGPVFLKDPRTGVFNFDETLLTIPDYKRFDFSRLPPYIPASQDETLRAVAVKHGQKYFASTSSITPALTNLVVGLTGIRPINMERLTSPFMSQLDSYTRLTRGLSGMILRRRDGVFGIDPFKLEEEEEKSVLMELTESFLLRAQLDCFHPDLPRRVFDVKTRATLPIRMDLANYLDNLGYRIRKLHGLYESFEREYYDMMRSAMIKYSLQVRIGRMDGIIVCFHTTAKILGFQYVPLEEMDIDLFGNSVFADRCFSLSFQLLRRLLDQITGHFGEADVQILFEPVEEGRITCHAIPGVTKEGTTEWDQTRGVKISIEIQSIVNGILVGTKPYVSKEDDEWLLDFKMTQTPAKGSEIKQALDDFAQLGKKRGANSKFMRILRENSTYDEE
ncbi:hypothetical protein HK105_205760 [Polyrhizophydium stewartii]|uniref:Uncharacterized protein n=1 Tax=Polyrhizophydium stewartii TaxID=2732419 RepID=A0ABR4N509_9FUNG